MAHYILLAMNGPKPGDGNDQAFNDWYNRIHLKDLAKVPGVQSDRRFKTVRGSVKTPYVALYEIETDDIEKVFALINAPENPIDPTFDYESSLHLVAMEVDTTA